MDRDFKITNVTACAPGGLVEDATIVVRDGRIVSVGVPPGDAASVDGGQSPDLPEVDGGGAYALPGFIDIHCHGAGLYETGAGVFDPATGEFDSSDSAMRDGLHDYVRAKAHEGVTAYYLATSAAPVEELQRGLTFVKEYMDSDSNGVEGPLVLGALLEGTFYNPAMAGAQDTRYAFEPARDCFDQINESGAVKLVNVAPEYGEAACKLIDHLGEIGVVCGAGHTDATGDQFRAAVEHGLRYVIHFTNGPTGGSYKPFSGGGTIEATLQLDDVYAELICDGYHINPQYIRDIIARKGRDRVIVITDQVFVAGTDVKTFGSGELKGEVAEDGSHVRVLGTRNTLFGSCTTMDKCFSNLMSYLTREMPGVWNRTHEALSLGDALSATSRMCSANAAKMIGLFDDPERGTGSLDPGKRADIVLGQLDGQPGDYRFDVQALWVGGRSISL
jgi:N-acetylglucosamine-6-phosphate deacetylase